MAVLRARHLADPTTDHGGRTLLVTFNNALVAYLRALQPPSLTAVRAETFHKFARGYLNSQGAMGWNWIVDGGQREALVRDAVTAVAPDPVSSPFDRPTRWFEDEFDWIAGNGIYERSVYEDPQQTERVGRKTPLRGPQRARVFDAFEEYHSQRAAARYRYDWADVGSEALKRLLADGAARHYRHVVIDEGQDFSPEMVRALVAAADPEGSVTFFGDYAQQIYGQRFSWRSVGLRVPQGVIEFVDNYRNSPEIARLAIAMARMEHFSDEPDLVEPVTPTASGPKPGLVRCRDRVHEADFAIEQAKRLSSASTVAILVRDRVNDEPLIRSRVPSGSTRLHKDMGTWSTAPGIWYGTYHAAKGLEFDHVLLPFCSADRLPDPEVVDTFGMEEALSREARILYVGVTRAKDRLIITHDGTPTPLLPADPALYTVADSR
jgi:superfamily I DNA/RNA helicase